MTDFQCYILTLLADGWHILDEPSAGAVRYDLREIVAAVEEVQPLIEQGHIEWQGQQGRLIVYGLTDKGRKALAKNRGNDGKATECFGLRSEDFAS